MSRPTFDKMIPGHGDSKDLVSLKGWTVVSVGMTTGGTYDGKERRTFMEGGLTLQLKKGVFRRKVILGYTELGLWVYEDKTSRSKK